jgi:CRISPR/Cas system CSM-associated protein Csm3 (group 7 of RAMP superfamily)
MLTFEMRLTLESPLHVGIGQPSIPADTALIVRDWRGRPCIPSTTIKGAHRHAAAELAAALGLTACQTTDPNQLCHPISGKPPCIICQMFGSTWIAGRLYYRDLVTTAPVAPITLVRSGHYRQRRVRRSVNRQQLEAVAAGSVFTGQIPHILANPAQQALALAALRSIRTLGAANSAGVGLVKIEVKPLDAAKVSINEHGLTSALEALRDAAKRKGNQP